MRGLAAEYVDNGLIRFITGQYSSGLPMAMMLGYVMNAQLHVARRLLRRAMHARSQAINLKSIIDRPVVTGCPLRFLSSHDGSSGRQIEIHLVGMAGRITPHPKGEHPADLSLTTNNCVPYESIIYNHIRA
jgi:hypothetical protein